jgi:hypothetical protein
MRGSRRRCCCSSRRLGQKVTIPRAKERDSVPLAVKGHDASRAAARALGCDPSKAGRRRGRRHARRARRSRSRTGPPPRCARCAQWGRADRAGVEGVAANNPSSTVPKLDRRVGEKSLGSSRLQDDHHRSRCSYKLLWQLSCDSPPVSRIVGLIPDRGRGPQFEAKRRSDQEE